MKRALFLLSIGILVSWAGALPALAVDENLIQNPSFEEGDARPVGWEFLSHQRNQTSVTYPTAGFHGERAVRVDVQRFRQGDILWRFTPVPVTAGEQYTFKNVSRSNVSTKIAARFTKQNGLFSSKTLGIVSPTGDWKPFEAVFTVPTGVTQVTIQQIIRTRGYLELDQYELNHTPKPYPTPAVLPRNGDFETAAAGNPNLPDAWTTGMWGDLTATFSYPVPGVVGRGAKIEVANYVSGDAKWVFDPIAAGTGKTYRITNRYQATVPTNVTVEYQLGDGSFQYDWVGDAPASATVWGTFDGQFTPPANATRFTVFQALTTNGSLTVDSYRISELPTLQNGRITLAFDDGFSSLYENGRPILNAGGIRSSQYITTGFVGTPSYMTWGEIATLRDEGHEIAAHTRTHAHLTELPPDQAWSEIRGSYDDLVAQGFAPRTFTYPYGEFNDAIKQMVRDAGFIGARSVFQGFNTPLSDRYALLDQHVESTTTVAQVEQWIQQALATKTWLILELHEQNNSGDQYSNTPEVLQGIVSAIQQSGIQVVTLAQGIDLLNQ